MRLLDAVDSDSAAAVLSFFAIHHIGPEDIAGALSEWHRILAPGGQLVLANMGGQRSHRLRR